MSRFSERKTVPDGVKKAIRETVKGSRTLPHFSQLAEEFLSMCGGPKRVAKMLFDEWQASTPGGVVRARILDLITRTWRYGSDTTSRTDDLGVLDDVDLDRELNKLLGEMNDGAEGEKTTG